MVLRSVPPLLLLRLRLRFRLRLCRMHSECQQIAECEQNARNASGAPWCTTVVAMAWQPSTSTLPPNATVGCFLRSGPLDATRCQQGANGRFHTYSLFPDPPSPPSAPPQPPAIPPSPTPRPPPPYMPGGAVPTFNRRFLEGVASNDLYEIRPAIHTPPRPRMPRQVHVDMHTAMQAQPHT